MLSVFIVSAIVHEYALSMGFGFFYPVMFCLFAVFGGEPTVEMIQSVLSDFTLTVHISRAFLQYIYLVFLFLGAKCDRNKLKIFVI